MYSFYIQRGHTLEELQKLPVEEQMFYMVTMEMYYDRLAQMLSSEDVDDSPKKKLSEVNMIDGNK